MDIKIKEINIQIFFDNGQRPFSCFCAFCCLFSKLVIYLISSATFVTYTLCFKFVLSLIDPILGLDSIHVIHLGSQIGRFAFPNREND